MRLFYEFFARDTPAVARALLGQRLVRLVEGQRVDGRIVEAEAYCGTEDMAAHWNNRRELGRFAVAYGRPGVSLVYFTYGLHWLFNVVTEPEGQPGAVLIRAIEPLEGLEVIEANRPGRDRHQWTAGPARLTMALGIGPEHHAVDLLAANATIFIEQDTPVPEAQVGISARIGLNRSPEPWKSLPQRFYVAGNRFVSR